MLLIGAAAAAGWGCAGVQSAIDPAGPQAQRIGRLWWLMLCILTAVYLFVMAVLAYAVMHRRRGEQGVESEKKRARAVGGAVAATIVILFGLLISDFVTGRALSSLERSEAVTIRVTGHQWWWDFEYLDPQPSRQVRTANEIHIPVGRPVKLEMTSQDVIHSFWVPNLHGKTDLMPGYQTAIWLQADRAGVFRGQCAEYCGHQHAHMAMLVVAEPEEEFERWLEHQRQPAAGPEDAEQAAGREIFLTRTCVMCHQIRGTDAAARTGPDLTHLASRQTIAAGTLANNRGNLGGWIIDPQQIKPGSRMPATSLNGEELQALLSFLQSLK